MASSSTYRARRSPLSFSQEEARQLIYELDHPLDPVSHAANLSIRRDYLVEKKRRLGASVCISYPGACQDDDAFRHTRLAKDIRNCDASIKIVNKALSELNFVGQHRPYSG
jgi:hypothetical protein